MSQNSFVYSPLFNKTGGDSVEFKRIDGLSEGVSECSTTVGGKPVTFLVIKPWVIAELTKHAFLDVSHLLRASHLQQLADILDDKEASPNDKFVSRELLKNACVSSGRVLPGCQDTGTAIVMGHKGNRIMVMDDTDDSGDDAMYISKGVYDAYTTGNLRYSQMAPLAMFSEVNTKTNLPAQIDISCHKGSEYEFLYIAKGGGSANKTVLAQQTMAVLNHNALYKFLHDTIKMTGTAACPPYHLAVVIGGLSAELNLKTVKLASCRYLDDLPTVGNEHGIAFRDLEWEGILLKMCQGLGIGAQFGGKYFAHDVRVIRLPRHGASCPIGVGVSCSADRQILAKINRDGVFLERLEDDPAKYLPSSSPVDMGACTPVDLSQPMSEILKVLRTLPIKSRVSLTGSLLVARDIAHAKIRDILNSTGDVPSYFKDHPIYYAGPAKTPEGLPSGSFGPTTAGRMDGYVDPFMSVGASMVTLAKGNRSRQVRDACAKHGGVYLGTIGGPAALLAEQSIKAVKVLEFEELGMEAIWKIEVVDFPAFVVIDAQGKDFFEEWLG
eukprot:GHVO01017236.1.p1 GENE.GHVO01017236.1~~GHVO01017236.1.p1  ORF type:complete len:560 (-),score=127.75 GHVO01017236.1:1691-3349(-)